MVVAAALAGCLAPAGRDGLAAVGVPSAMVPDSRLIVPTHGRNAGVPIMTLDHAAFARGRPVSATIRLGGPTPAVDSIIFALMTDPDGRRLDRLFAIHRRVGFERIRPSAGRVGGGDMWAPGRDPVEVVTARNTVVRGRAYTIVTMRVHLRGSQAGGCFEILGHPIRVEDGQMLAVRVVGPRRACGP